MPPPSMPDALSLPLKPLVQGKEPMRNSPIFSLYPPQSTPTFSVSLLSKATSTKGNRVSSGRKQDSFRVCLVPRLLLADFSPQGPLAASVLPQVLTPVQSQVRLQATGLKTQRPPLSPGHGPPLCPGMGFNTAATSLFLGPAARPCPARVSLLCSYPESHTDWAQSAR